MRMISAHAGKSEDMEKGRSKRPGAKYINEILATAAHDLLGPVGAIVLFSELLEEEVGELLDASQRETLSNIRSAGELVVKLIDDLLAVSKRGLNLSLGPVDLVSLANESISLHRPAANQKKISLVLHSDAQIPPVRLDQLKIMRVINELLSNAIRFSEPGQGVALGLSLRGQVVEIAVSDEGPGISPKDLKGLFLPFHKHTRHCPQGGRGLGLAITKKIVDAHKGRIRVKSRPGTGSTFSVSLPTDL
jgi:two-component system, sensor histidine kinase and response regulator